MAVRGSDEFGTNPYFESVKLNRLFDWAVGYRAADFMRGLRVSGFAESSGTKGVQNAWFSFASFIAADCPVLSDCCSEWMSVMSRGRLSGIYELSVSAKF